MKSLSKKLFRSLGIVSLALALGGDNYERKSSDSVETRVERSDEENLYTAYVLMHEGVGILEQSDYNPQVGKYALEHFKLAENFIKDVDKKEGELYDIITAYQKIGLELIKRKENPEKKEKILHDAQDIDMNNYFHQAISR